MLSIRSLLRKKEKERQIMRFVRNKRTKKLRICCDAVCCWCGGTGRMYDGSVCYHCQGTGVEP